jgi:hypothetical protein
MEGKVVNMLKTREKCSTKAPGDSEQSILGAIFLSSNLTPPVTSCVILNVFLNLFVPQFPHL